MQISNPEWVQAHTFLTPILYSVAGILLVIVVVMALWNRGSKNTRDAESNRQKSSGSASPNITATHGSTINYHGGTEPVPSRRKEYAKLVPPKTRRCFVFVDGTVFRECSSDHEDSFLVFLATFNCDASPLSAQLLYSVNGDSMRVAGCWLEAEDPYIDGIPGSLHELILLANGLEGNFAVDDRRNNRDPGSTVRFRVVPVTSQFAFIDAHTFLGDAEGPAFRFKISFNESGVPNSVDSIG